MAHKRNQTSLNVDRIRAVKQAHETELLTKRNVVGVGIGFRQRGGQRTNELALIVMVREKLPQTQLTVDDLIPYEIEGVPVDVQEVGEIRAH